MVLRMRDVQLLYLRLRNRKMKKKTYENGRRKATVEMSGGHYKVLMYGPENEEVYLPDVEFHEEFKSAEKQAKVWITERGAQ